MYQSITTSNYTFEDIITGGDLYVDKTDFIHKLITVNKVTFFLSRPRRFGKSLSGSILKNIFKGNKELFRSISRKRKGTS